MKSTFIIAMASLVIALSGCYNSKKATDQVNKAVNHYPVQTAVQLRAKWPCVPLATITDSTEYKKYQQDLQSVIDMYENRHPEQPKPVILVDTVTDSSKIVYYRNLNGQLTSQLEQRNIYIADLKKICKDKPPIHDTIHIRDMTDSTIYGAKEAVLLKKIDKLNNKIDNKNLWLKMLAGLAALGGVFVFILLKRK